MGGGGEVWRSYSVYTSGYHSVDRLSDIDEFEESVKIGSSNLPGTPLQDSFGNLSLDTSELLGVTVGDYVEEVEDIEGVFEEDEDSTPHIMSETSKTQSPISTIEKVSLDRQLGEPFGQEEDEVIQRFNQGVRGNSLAEELALQIELIESDKSILQGESGGVKGNLLQPEEKNAKQFWDNKISQQTLEHHVKPNLRGEDTSLARSIQAKADFGIVSGNISSISMYTI